MSKSAVFSTSTQIPSAEPKLLIYLLHDIEILQNDPAKLQDCLCTGLADFPNKSGQKQH